MRTEVPRSGFPRSGFPRPGPAALALAAGLFVSQPAAAQTGAAQTGTVQAAQEGCAAMVERFAADLGLSTAPPPVAVPGPPGLSGSTPRDEPGSGSGGRGAQGPDSERLAQSGGMVAPPAVDDRSVIAPPSIGSTMPTAPAVGPQAGSRAAPDSGPGGSGGGDGLMGQAARNAQLESLVTAARGAARDGDETRCMTSLDDARRLSRTAPGGHGG
ncbi:hypothetical protein AZL_024530 [Azospirillum sp. B510]|uniref:hypothetical protein n=1 Tax=Azospirillum sp. (strain B510) TaxID=137722 RepID=UPI0001C4CA8B|nr:hypothetical protein [Azospirillum sp. B510]BAI73091.1 hypothetical protein AZL_024530 [Azospirillum sp. B510]